MTAEPLHESLAALGHLAMREAGAAGYGLYRLDLRSGALIRLQACGARVAELGLSEELLSGVSLFARVKGLETHVLTFVFRSCAISEDVAGILSQIAGVVESLLGLSLYEERAASLARRAAESEAELICAKIRDRARGLAQNPSPKGVGTETLARFSETLIQHQETSAFLHRLAAEREEALQERRLTSQAKAVLESVYGMSEDQAHHHLRLASRKSRRPLREVALEYIGKRS